MGREFVRVSLGQAGVHAEYYFWKQLCHEQQINESGVPNRAQSNGYNATHPHSFAERSNGTFTPRCLFIDGEEDVCDDLIRGGKLQNLFEPEFVITGNEDASSCFARGKFFVAKQVATQVVIEFRRLIEQCESIYQLDVTHSLAGGTGSGTTSTILLALHDLYQLPATSNCIIPSRRPTNILAPYNSILKLNDSMEYFRLRYFYQNDAILRLLAPCLKAEGIRGSYADINHAIACLTSNLSVEGAKNLTSFETMLVPFPRLNIILSAFCPLLPRGTNIPLTEKNLVSLAFFESNEMVNFHANDGKYMSTWLLFRGEVGYHDEFYSEFSSCFVDWNPKGFNFCVDHAKFTHEPQFDYLMNPSTCLVKISNHTVALEQETQRLLDQFALLYEQRAYVSWYLSEGMEEGEFTEAMESVQSTIDFVKTRVMEGAANEEE